MAADPIVETRTVIRTVCPEELRLALPAPIARPADAVLEFNQAGAEFVNGRFRREELLAQRLADAAAGCPEPVQ